MKMSIYDEYSLIIHNYIDYISHCRVTMIDIKMSYDLFTDCLADLYC